MLTLKEASRSRYTPGEATPRGARNRSRPQPRVPLSAVRCRRRVGAAAVALGVARRRRGRRPCSVKRRRRWQTSRTWRRARAGIEAGIEDQWGRPLGAADAPPTTTAIPTRTTHRGPRRLMFRSDAARLDVSTDAGDGRHRPVQRLGDRRPCASSSRSAREADKVAGSSCADQRRAPRARRGDARADADLPPRLSAKDERLPKYFAVGAGKADNRSSPLSAGVVLLAEPLGRRRRRRQARVGARCSATDPDVVDVSCASKFFSGPPPCPEPGRVSVQSPRAG